jgi:hypothetical protein
MEAQYLKAPDEVTRRYLTNLWRLRLDLDAQKLLMRNWYCLVLYPTRPSGLAVARIRLTLPREHGRARLFKYAEIADAAIGLADRLLLEDRVRLCPP